MVIAVYGTLRRGLENHALLENGGACYIGTDSVAGFDLYAGQYPYLTPGEGVVAVELYEVTASCLSDLDTLEGHPTLYERTSILTLGCVKADIYLYSKYKILPGTPKTQGDWIEWLELQK
ncbi:MAG: gamma-glutamylcyclotransferase [Verrucomicrobia bacterium]|jgi:gamma-glutamylcyclotransferase (GGCT)/AIG2-like uncharacterized protein YtfP|nr:MAG: gamma-glutamylcyclotransferase [Verrucomicrobiota bacterium]